MLYWIFWIFFVIYLVKLVSRPKSHDIKTPKFGLSMTKTQSDEKTKRINHKIKY